MDTCCNIHDDTNTHNHNSRWTVVAVSIMRLILIITIVDGHRDSRSPYVTSLPDEVPAASFSITIVLVHYSMYYLISSIYYMITIVYTW